MKSGLGRGDVALVSGATRYPVSPPFDPPARYPELEDVAGEGVDAANDVYPMVRQAMHLLGLDSGRYGHRAWNPLGEVVRPGDTVLIKPNLVLHYNAGGGALEAVVTHPSVLRPLLDYSLIALAGRGRIVVGDSPQMNCEFPELLAQLGLDRLAEYGREVCGRTGVRFDVVDFRLERTRYRHGIVWERHRLPARRGVVVDVGSGSLLAGKDNSRLYGADYDRRVTMAAHDGRHEYVVASDLLEADVVISVPKLKVHRKVGTTLNLKNMVGINVDKNHLAHYRIGPPHLGGDEQAQASWDDRVDRLLSDTLLGRAWRPGRYPFVVWRAARTLWRHAVPRPYLPTHGDWFGNDTAWRMALDLNRVVLCARPDGTVADEPVRRYFSVVDGVIGGEGEGPLHPDPVASGIILAGLNPLAVDWVGTLAMGLDPARIPMYRQSWEHLKAWAPGVDPDTVVVRSNRPDLEHLLDDPALAPCRFTVPTGWKGRIEIGNTSPRYTRAGGA